MLKAFFERFRKKRLPAPPRYPSRGEETEWVEAKLAHARERDREHAVNFFDPASGDYFPTVLHVASSLTPELRDAYRAVRDRYPELAAEAARRVPSYCVSRVALHEDLERNRHRIHV
ncbi:hypothetical protein [Paracoccus sp. ME4]|uniref:hypothetical protein n=1 Tax=Paracoccus sp. ME4 TaxID=3138066 RepID=UPI00398B3B1B